MKAQKKKDVLKALKAQGWKMIRNDGNHEMWQGPDGKEEPIARHNEVSVGVIRKLSKKMEKVPDSWK